MPEPRGFVATELISGGLILLLLGLVAGLSATERTEEDEAFALMWAGVSGVLSGILVVFPGIESFLRRRSGHVRR
jgi:hypothetical protein